MHGLIKKPYFEILILLFLVSFSLAIRVYKITLIPLNVTGDEIGYIADLYTFYIHGFHALEFISDGSVAGINFILPFILTKILGIHQALFALRFSTALLSTLALIPFYYLLRSKTNRDIAFLFTALLSVNYTYLNFSRTGWINNILMIFITLLLLLCLEKSKDKFQIHWFLLAGLFTAFNVYGYLYGKFLVFFIFVYLIVKSIFIDHFNKKAVKGFIVFTITFFLVSSPFVYKAFTDSEKNVLARPQATYAFSHQVPLLQTATSQLTSTLQGYLLFNPKVMGKGIENMRYAPMGNPPIDPIMRLLFFLGLGLCVLHPKKTLLGLTLILSILLINFITSNPPNFARGLLFIPLIYFLNGIITYYGINTVVSKNPLFKKPSLAFNIIGVCIVSGLFIYNLFVYFIWINSPQTLNARQPAIPFNEFSTFQEYQIDTIKKGNTAISVYDWDRIRDQYNYGKISTK